MSIELHPSIVNNLVPLSRAVLCCNCEQITDRCKKCIACGSRALLVMAKILNQPESILLKLHHPGARILDAIGQAALANNGHIRRPPSRWAAFSRKLERAIKVPETIHVQPSKKNQMTVISNSRKTDGNAAQFNPTEFARLQARL
jgi:hypothetical protein